MTSSAQFAGPWFVVNCYNGRPLESHKTEAAAARACDIVNMHNLTHGHADRYTVQFRGTK